MEIAKLMAFSICILVLLSILKQYNPGAAVLTALGGCIVLIWYIVRAAEPIVEFVKMLSQMSGFEHLDSVLKAVAITLLTQSVQDLCTQSGQTALAGRIELAGKIAVLAAALPLFAVLTDTLLALLG